MTSQVFITIRIFFNIIKCFIKKYIFIIIIMLLILQEQVITSSGSKMNKFSVTK